MSFSKEQKATLKKDPKKLCELLADEDNEIGKVWREKFADWSESMEERLVELAKGKDTSTVTRFTWVNTGDMSASFFALCKETQTIAKDHKVSSSLIYLADYAMAHLPIPDNLMTKKRLMVKVEDFHKGGAYAGKTKPQKPTKSSSKKTTNDDDETSEDDAPQKSAKKTPSKKAKSTKPAKKSSSKKSPERTPQTVPKKKQTTPATSTNIKRRKVVQKNTDYDSDGSCCTLPPVVSKAAKKLNEIATKFVALEADRQVKGEPIAAAIFKEQKIITEAATVLNDKVEVSSSIVQFIDAIMRTLRIWLVASIDEALGINMPSLVLPYSEFISCVCRVLVGWLGIPALEPFISDIFCDSKGLILSAAIEDIKQQIPAVGDLMAAVTKTASFSSSPVWKSFYRVGAPSPECIRPPELGTVSAVMCVPTFS